MIKKLETDSFETDEYVVNWNIDLKTKNLIFDRLLKYYISHEAYNGETICQCDDAQIDASNVLSDIADKLFKFKVNYK